MLKPSESQVERVTKTGSYPPNVIEAVLKDFQVMMERFEADGTGCLSQIQQSTIDFMFVVFIAGLHAGLSIDTHTHAVFRKIASVHLNNMLNIISSEDAQTDETRPEHLN